MLKKKLYILLLLGLVFLEQGQGEEKKEDDKLSKADTLRVPYLDVGTLVIPMIKRGKVISYMRFKVQIVTVDESPADPYFRYKPLLYNNYFWDLYAVIGDRWLPGTPIKQESVLKRLSAVTDKLLGSKRVKPLITGFYIYTPS